MEACQLQIKQQEHTIGSNGQFKSKEKLELDFRMAIDYND